MMSTVFGDWLLAASWIGFCEVFFQVKVIAIGDNYSTADKK